MMHFNSLLTVPSEPINLRYENISASSIRLFWDPPPEPNGVLQSYRVTYVESGTERTVMESDIEPGNETSGFVVEPLMEYHEYLVTVAARTDQGFGDESLPLDVLTEEHGILYIHTYIKTG